MKNKGLFMIPMNFAVTMQQHRFRDNLSSFMQASSIKYSKGSTLHSRVREILRVVCSSSLELQEFLFPRVDKDIFLRHFSLEAQNSFCIISNFTLSTAQEDIFIIHLQVKNSSFSSPKFL
jgi:hypothetical protein